MDRSIRNIKLNKTNKRMASRLETKSRVDKQNPEKYKKRKSVFSLPVIISSSVTLFLLFIIYILVSPAKADVALKIKERLITLSDGIVHIAYKEGDDEMADLYYQVKNTELSASLALDADKEEYEETRAKGTITVYNEFSHNPQRIITNTRFETNDGKIYRVRHSFVIPGYKRKGGEIEPGKVDIVVYADDVGSDYNISKGTRFTLPGLSNDKGRYNKIYAIAKTDIKGGFKGKRKTISQERKSEAIESLKKEIVDKAFESVKASYENALVFKDAVLADFKDPDISVENDKVKITLNAKVATILFDKFDFAKYLLENNSNDTLDTDEKVYIVNTDDLKFKLVNKEDVDLETDTIVKFTIAGKARIVWFFDEESFKKDLTGKSSVIVPQIAESYKAIDGEPNVSLAPYWADTLPEDIEKINIIYTNKDLPNQ